MTKRLLTVLAAMALTATGLLLLATTASAAGTAAQGKSKYKKTLVSGDSTPSQCNDGKGVGAIELTGDLEGCLTFFPKRFKCEELSGFARTQEWGRETFQGTRNGKSGTFRTKYKIVGTYKQGSCEEFNSGGFPFKDQITGTCDHRIVHGSGTGAFKGYRGLITFYDQIPVVGEGATNFFYAGNLKQRRK